MGLVGEHLRQQGLGLTMAATNDQDGGQGGAGVGQIGVVGGQDALAQLEGGAQLDLGLHGPRALGQEAARRGVAPLVLFVADSDRASQRSYAALRMRVPERMFVTIDNEFVLRGERPAAFDYGWLVEIAALPVFLKTYIDRIGFSFTGYLRGEADTSTELHQWIRDNYFSFREFELRLMLQNG